ncbi:hypothetical protein [Aquimarina litoralis]|uniref:hypothetical protein n=1 Tax=Aquimarina litoralis TaxID=584605 RepID=UPI001C5681D4|nr:hypothetical protein [Aquimarina litoralis]MBW1295886.1 hypothetical protein [Aquimarina litoralis]
MFHRYILILTCCFSVTSTLSGYAQNKVEKEYRIKKTEVPKNALDFINKCSFKKKIKWYAEESQDGKSIEAKTYHQNRKYSIEFDSSGKPEDVEIKIPFSTIPNDLQNRIQSSLDSIFVKSKIKKIQKQWISDRSTLISLIKRETTRNKHTTNYELIIKGKKEKHSDYYELLYSDKGVLLQMLRIVSANTDNLIY